ncbi:hypothetical protein ABZ281_32600, partial [Streptomyces sp. NPDC006265]
MEASSHDESREFVAMRSTALLRLTVPLTGGDRHAAEDLLQTALMKVYGRWARIEQHPERQHDRLPSASGRRLTRRAPGRGGTPTPAPGPVDDMGLGSRN